MIRAAVRTLRRVDAYRRTVGARGLLSAALGLLRRRPELLQVEPLGVVHPLFLRVPSSDVPTFEQVFISKQYEFGVKWAPKYIIDAGANIGLAAVYFANKFPDARIVAIEPEASNLEILRRNVAPYPNITVACAALWHEDSTIDLVDPGLGNWGFMVQAGHDGERYGPVVHTVRSVTVDAVMRQYGIDHVDILKMDIEGSEREVFGDPSAWIDAVDAMIVELHDRMKPGCSRSFYLGSADFENEWLQGENVYMARRRSCLGRPA